MGWEGNLFFVWVWAWIGSIWRHRFGLAWIGLDCMGFGSFERMLYSFLLLYGLYGGGIMSKMLGGEAIRNGNEE